MSCYGSVEEVDRIIVICASAPHLTGIVVAGTNFLTLLPLPVSHLELQELLHVRISISNTVDFGIGVIPGGGRNFRRTYGKRSK